MILTRLIIWGAKVLIFFETAFYLFEKLVKKYHFVSFLNLIENSMNSSLNRLLFQELLPLGFVAVEHIYVDIGLNAVHLSIR